MIRCRCEYVLAHILHLNFACQLKIVKALATTEFYEQSVDVIFPFFMSFSSVR